MNAQEQKIAILEQKIKDLQKQNVLILEQLIELSEIVAEQINQNQ